MLHTAHSLHREHLHHTDPLCTHSAHLGGNLCLPLTCDLCSVYSLTLSGYHRISITSTAALRFYGFSYSTDDSSFFGSIQYPLTSLPGRIRLRQCTVYVHENQTHTCTTVPAPILSSQQNDVGERQRAGVRELTHPCRECKSPREARRRATECQPQGGRGRASPPPPRGRRLTSAQTPSRCSSCRPCCVRARAV